MVTPFNKKDKQQIQEFKKLLKLKHKLNIKLLIYKSKIKD